MRILLLGLVFAAASAMAQTPPIPPAPTALQPLSIWEPGQAGALEHLQSGLVCPAKIGAYARTVATQFDAFGLDVGCSYVAGPTTITLYLTRRSGHGLDADMAEARRQVLDSGAAFHPQALPDATSTDQGLDWTTALYALDGGQRASIWIADLSGWTLEYRATYALSEEARVVADLSPFTALVRKSAGVRLELCARSPPPRRGAKAISNQRNLEESSMMSSIMGGVFLSMAQEGEAGQEKPIFWCAEQPVLVDDRHMLFWRGVGPDGEDARIDRISLVTVDKPLTLLIAPDPAAILDDLAKSADKQPRWTATIDAGDQVLIFGYFNGRPAAEAVSDLFVKIQTGKAKAVGGYGAKDNTVTIALPPKP